MKHWLAFYVCVLASLWIVLAGLRTLLRQRLRPATRTVRAEAPRSRDARSRDARSRDARGRGIQAFARLLATAGASAYARDQIQGRLRLLAEDLAALDGEPLQGDAALTAYFAEDPVGFRSDSARKSPLDHDFLRRTEELVAHLERHGPPLPGDPP